ncbi:MAG: hypothetical protein MK008_03290 [Bdellovibrionales bacterium]|nr:hypothetical protein [Bdellovibrionales bacterium]
MWKYYLTITGVVCMSLTSFGVSENEYMDDISSSLASDTLAFYEEARVRNTQQYLFEDLKQCSFIDDPSADEVECPTLQPYTYFKGYKSIPTCNKHLFGFNRRSWSLLSTCSSPIKMSTNPVIDVSVAPDIEAPMAFEVIPVQIKNLDVCVWTNKENLNDDKPKYEPCEGLLLKNVAGIKNNKKTYFGHVVIAPINKNIGNAEVFAERVKLAMGHISPSQAIPLQSARYGGRSFNPQNYLEGYSVMSHLSLGRDRYPLSELELIDLRTNEEYQSPSENPYFVFGSTNIKFGYDFRYFEQSTLGILNLNEVEPEDIVKDVSDSQ